MNKKDFLVRIKKRNPRVNLIKVQMAYEFAEMSHQGKKRRTGEAFINHPMEVAILMSKYCSDTASICAALLHDVVEDTDVTVEEMEKRFGKTVAFLVDGVTKVNTKKSDKLNKQLTIKKVLKYGEKDARVIYLKFVDKMHNLETLDVFPKETQKIIIDELKTMYIPEAQRIGFTQAEKKFKEKYELFYRHIKRKRKNP